MSDIQDSLKQPLLEQDENTKGPEEASDANRSSTDLGLSIDEAPVD